MGNSYAWKKACKVWMRPAERAKRIAYKARKRLEAGMRPRLSTAESIEQRKCEADAGRAWRQWMRDAPKAWLTAYWVSAGKPWRAPGLTSAEKFVAQYRNDPAFADKQRARIAARRHANPTYAKQWSKDQHGRWQCVVSAADGSVDAVVMQGLQQDRYCSYCMCEVHHATRRIDHVQPLALGGQHSADNLVVACVDCNMSKAASPLLGWLLARTLKNSSGPSQLLPAGGSAAARFV